jgi:hypothetical protein
MYPWLRPEHDYLSSQQTPPSAECSPQKAMARSSVTTCSMEL